MKAAMSFLRPLDPEMREIDALLQLAKNIKKERDQPIKFINISTEP
jgi:ornithine carbamoyltransferase